MSNLTARQFQNTLQVLRLFDLRSLHRSGETDEICIKTTVLLPTE